MSLFSGVITNTTSYTNSLTSPIVSTPIQDEIVPLDSSKDGIGSQLKPKHMALNQTYENNVTIVANQATFQPNNDTLELQFTAPDTIVNGSVTDLTLFDPNGTSVLLGDSSINATYFPISITNVTQTNSTVQTYTETTPFGEINHNLTLTWSVQNTSQLFTPDQNTTTVSINVTADLPAHDVVLGNWSFQFGINTTQDEPLTYEYSFLVEDTIVVSNQNAYVLRTQNTTHPIFEPEPYQANHSILSPDTLVFQWTDNPTGNDTVLT